MKTLKKGIALLALLLFALSLYSGCQIGADDTESRTYQSSGEVWNCGFGRRQIIPDENGDGPLYIAGYQNGVEITGVLDYCEARAVWIDTGAKGVLLIGIDCVGLDSGTVAKIRSSLAGIPNCASINIYSTHTHAGIDTLGLWGPIGVDGKNDAYMDNLITAAVEAGREAAENTTSGSLYYGFVETSEMYRDSRNPQVYDANLYQLRFSPDDGSAGIRLYFYGAHAESLRGDNTMLSRDFAGILCDRMQEVTGDNTMFFPGAIGGLIMTKAFVENTTTGAQMNLRLTGDKLVMYAKMIYPGREQELSPKLTVSRVDFTIPMDNTVFMLYKYLGILTNQVAEADSATGYGCRTELSVVMLDDIALTLIPGEIFPELVYGGKFGDANPDGENPLTLTEIAEAYGIRKLLVVGLANDEIGYIVPPSDFLVNEKLPYLERVMDKKGEDHYEETNSLGPKSAVCIADAFRSALAAIH